MWMVVGEFLFLVTKSLKSRRLDLLSNHEICFQNFSFSSRNWRKLQISRLFFAKILVLFSNQKTDLDISLFSSRNSRYGFHISLSLLDITFWHLVNAFKAGSATCQSDNWSTCEHSWCQRLTPWVNWKQEQYFSTYDCTTETPYIHAAPPGAKK